MSHPYRIRKYRLLGTGTQTPLPRSSGWRGSEAPGDEPRARAAERKGFSQSSPSRDLPSQAWRAVKIKKYHLAAAWTVVTPHRPEPVSDDVLRIAAARVADTLRSAPQQDTEAARQEAPGPQEQDAAGHKTDPALDAWRQADLFDDVAPVPEELGLEPAAAGPQDCAADARRDADSLLREGAVDREQDAFDAGQADAAFVPLEPLEPVEPTAEAGDETAASVGPVLVPSPQDPAPPTALVEDASGPEGRQRPDPSSSPVAAIPSASPPRRMTALASATAALMFMAVPTATVGYYSLTKFQPRYVSTAEVVVAQPSGGSMPSDAGATPSARPQSLDVRAYLVSREAMRRLDADLDIRAYFASEAIAPAARLAADASEEALFATYLEHITAVYNPDRETISLRIVTGDGVKGEHYAEALIGYAEEKVFHMDKDLRASAMSGARALYEQAEQRMMAAQLRVLDLQALREGNAQSAGQTGAEVGQDGATAATSLDIEAALRELEEAQLAFSQVFPLMEQKMAALQSDTLSLSVAQYPVTVVEQVYPRMARNMGVAFLGSLLSLLILAMAARQFRAREPAAR